MNEQSIIGLFKTDQKFHISTQNECINPHNLLFFLQKKHSTM